MYLNIEIDLQSIYYIFLKLLQCDASRSNFRKLCSVCTAKISLVPRAQQMQCFLDTGIPADPACAADPTKDPHEHCAALAWARS